MTESIVIIDKQGNHTGIATNPLHVTGQNDANLDEDGNLSLQWLVNNGLVDSFDMETTFIYGLYDPRNDELRYIGKANNLKKRLWDHIDEAKKGRKSHKNDWVRLLLKNDLTPIIRILEEVSIDDWQQAETKWINKCRENGERLTNLTNGGEGIHGYHYTEEQKRAISERNPWKGKVGWNKGKKLSPERIEQIRQVNLGNKYSVGRKHSDEAKRKMSIARKGRVSPTKGKKLSEETKYKLSIASTGRKLSEEARQKISNFHKGKPKSEETKEKLRQANLGKHHSEETRRKMKENHKAPSLETRQKWSEDRKGNKHALGLRHSEETKKKISDASKRYWAKRKGLLSNED